jgi:hypothetical protein
MLDRQRSEVSVVGEVAAGTEGHEQAAEYLKMPRGGLHQDARRLGKPGLDAIWLSSREIVSRSSARNGALPLLNYSPSAFPGKGIP